MDTSAPGMISTGARLRAKVRTMWTPRRPQWVRQCHLCKHTRMSHDRWRFGSECVVCPAGYCPQFTSRLKALRLRVVMRLKARLSKRGNYA